MLWVSRPLGDPRQGLWSWQQLGDTPLRRSERLVLAPRHHPLGGHHLHLRDPQEMRTFVKVVEWGSMTAAAERLGIAKSAVSRRLADLEGRLSVQLFRRTTRTLKVTDTGQGFYERCLRILADVEEAELAVSQAHGTLGDGCGWRCPSPSAWGTWVLPSMPS